MRDGVDREGRWSFRSHQDFSSGRYDPRAGRFSSRLGAALVHFGVLLHGYEHRKAGIAESVIAIVLLVGLALTWIRPGLTRGIGLSAQALALFGTLVGLFTIAIGVGPRRAPDIAYHIGIILVLVSGLIVASRARLDRARPGM